MVGLGRATPPAALAEERFGSLATLRERIAYGYVTPALVEDALRRALRAIVREGWNQRSPWNSSALRAPAGVLPSSALVHAVEDMAAEGLTDNFGKTQVFHGAVYTLSEIVGQNFNAWNDQRGRTPDEVEKAFLRAIYRVRNLEDQP
jgi:hypothetical protein